MKQYLIFLIFSLQLVANTFNVSTTIELRQALEDAALNGENDTIVLKSGIYSTTSDGLGTFTFNDAEEHNLTIMGADGYDMNSIILDGNNTHQVMNFANNKGFTLTLKNLSVINGNASSNGGGFYTNGNAIVEDCNVSNNSVGWNGDGGGFYSFGSVTMINSIVINNDSYNASGFYSNSDTILINSIISDNVSVGSNGKGGGFYSNGNTEATDSTIANNKSGSGGGFYTNGRVIIKDCNISNNIACRNGGSGFYSSTNTTVINSVIKNNGNSSECSGDGGGFNSSGNTIVLNSIISNNGTAGIGGGFNSSGNTEVFNSIIANNKSGYGGGFYSKGYIISLNSNFIKNSRKLEGYGVFINNIFIEDGVDFANDSKFYNNYIDYANLSENNHIVIKKSNLLPQVVGDIKLADDNITLQSDSPAIDAGLNPTDDLFKGAFDEETYTKIAKYFKVDYFGKERIANGKTDIGASEYGSISVVENRPRISIDFAGNQKVYRPIDVNFTIDSTNSISELYIDKGNGYEAVEINLRSFKVIFDTTGEHTIKIKAIDNQENTGEIAKTITIYNLTMQEAIEYGKELCRNNPAGCGIDIDTTQKDIFENQKLIDTQNGWRLLGSNIDFSAEKIFDKNPNISIVWTYSKGKWRAKGANNIIDKMISDAGIQPVTTIENGDGFWVYVK